MKKIITSLGMLVFVAAVVAGGTGAFFSDTETSSANVFTAGALDLKVDSVGHYNGLVCFNKLWHPEDTVIWNDEIDPPAQQLVVTQGELAEAIEEYNDPLNPQLNPEVLAGSPCGSTWEMTDLGPENVFFDFGDLKPGDNGENTISLHVDDNDAYMCAAIHNVSSDDNGLTEPEEEDGDNTDGLNNGELDQELNFLVWEDDGDNILQEEELGDDEEGILYEGLAGEGLAGVYPLYTPQTQVFPGGATKYLGVYWCYGEIEREGAEVSCNGAPVTNVTQTDSLEASITFYIEQARNNGQFTCPALSEFQEEEGRPVGAALGDYDAPEAGMCNATVSDSQSIQTALNGVSANQTVCVAPSYDRTGDNVAIRMETTGVTLAAQTQGILLDVPVVLSADGVTVTGFEGTIGQAESPAELAAFYFDGDATNASLTFSEVNAGVGAAVLTETGADNSGGLIQNNVFTGVTQGIYLNPHTGQIMISYNDFSDNVVGIAGFNGALVVANEFTHTTPGSEAIGIDGSFDSNGGSITNNNFLDDTEINAYDVTPFGNIDNTVDAENNFFNISGAAQTNDPIIDFTPEAVVQFPHN